MKIIIEYDAGITTDEALKLIIGFYNETDLSISGTIITSKHLICYGKKLKHGQTDKFVIQKHEAKLLEVA